MKIMRLLAFTSVLCMFSCDVVDYFQESQLSNHFKSLQKEFAGIVRGSFSCEVKAKKLQRLSKKFEQHIDHSQKNDYWRQGKLCSEFYALFLQGRYNEAYGMGMSTRAFFEDVGLPSDLVAELAFLAKLLDRFPEHQEQSELWKRRSLERLKSSFEYMAPHLCLSDSQKLELSEWLETLEPPPTPAEE